MQRRASLQSCAVAVFSEACGRLQRVKLCRALGGLGMRGGHLLQRQLLQHLLAQEARPHARPHLLQRAHLPRRGPPLRLRLPPLLVRPCPIHTLLCCRCTDTLCLCIMHMHPTTRACPATSSCTCAHTPCLFAATCLCASQPCSPNRIISRKYMRKVIPLKQERCH